MTRAQAWGIHVSALLVGGTGLVYGWMRYFVVPEDELALVNHPLQPTFQHLHLLFAPLLVFSCALVWGEHVWKRARNGYPVRRRTGLVLLALFAPMVLSGAWVQIAEGDLGRGIAVALHVGAGVLWCVAYAVHQLTRAARERAQPISESSVPAPRVTAASNRST